MFRYKNSESGSHMEDLTWEDGIVGGRLSQPVL